MTEIITGLIAGIIVGAIFTLIKFPLPAPPVLSGIIGILGVWVGMKLKQIPIVSENHSLIDRKVMPNALFLVEIMVYATGSKSQIGSFGRWGRFNDVEDAKIICESFNKKDITLAK